MVTIYLHLDAILEADCIDELLKSPGLVAAYLPPVPHCHAQRLHYSCPVSTDPPHSGYR
jgi:hypothetical protein